MSRIKEADKRRLERRAIWEATQTPEQIQAADQERLSVLRLKFRWREASLKVAMVHATIGNVGRRTHRELDSNKYLRTIAQEARVAATGHFQGKLVKAKQEARAMHLSRAFMRGTPYSKAEQRCYSRPDFSRVVDIILEHAFGDERIYNQRIEQWMQAAQQASNLYEVATDEFGGKVTRKVDHAQWERDTLVRLREKGAALQASIALFSGLVDAQ